MARCMFTSAVRSCGSSGLSPARGSLPAGPWTSTNPAAVELVKRLVAGTWLASRGPLDIDQSRRRGSRAEDDRLARQEVEPGRRPSVIGGDRLPLADLDHHRAG